MSNKNYCSRTTQLLKKFDKSIARVKHLLIARFGEDQAHALIIDSRREYVSLIPKIPYIGEKNRRLIFLLPTTRYLAVYRALQRQGRTVEDAGQLIYDMSEAELKAMSAIIRRAIAYFWFFPWFGSRLKKRAKESQERRFAGDFVFEFIKGDGKEFDYGIDYIECANVKFLQVQDAMELAPYVCAVDKIASEMLGWGLTRTMTLAEGCERCDFRFKKGGKTSVPLPQSLVQLE